MISVSLSGYINYLDPRTPHPVRVIKGHNKPITKMIKDKDARLKNRTIDNECISELLIAPHQ